MPLDCDTFFRAMADETRRRCLLLLATHGELCVCELTHALGLPQPKISHHLGALRKAGIVSDSKRGLWVDYRLHPKLPSWCREVLLETRRAMATVSPYREDAAALSAMPARPGAACTA